MDTYILQLQSEQHMDHYHLVEVVEEQPLPDFLQEL